MRNFFKKSSKNVQSGARNINFHGFFPPKTPIFFAGKTPFVIALNKIDRLYEYESNPRKDVYELLKSQKPRVQAEFKERFNQIVVEFAEQELNVTLSNHKNAEDSDYVCMVPTSAFLGDGIGNLMAFIVNQTQTKHAQKLAFSEELDATVMEVKAIPGTAISSNFRRKLTEKNWKNGKFYT